MEETKTSKVLEVLKKVWGIITKTVKKVYDFVFADIIRLLILVYGLNVVTALLGGNLNNELFGIQSLSTVILLLIYKYKNNK